MFGGAYVFFFRGVPMLVQLLLVYYLLPFVGINVSPLVAAISAVSLCSASYIAEILRGGFLSIPPGQIEAARMLGMSPLDMLRRIQVPQAFRLTLPSLVNEMVLLIKASSLISVVGVAELTRTAQNIAASTYRPLEAYLAAGLIYFVICGTLALLAHGAEHRLQQA
jgi:polar amino acid transport system permease protein